MTRGQKSSAVPPQNQTVANVQAGDLFNAKLGTVAGDGNSLTLTDSGNKLLPVWNAGRQRNVFVISSVVLLALVILMTILFANAKSKLRNAGIA